MGPAGGRSGAGRALGASAPRGHSPVLGALQWEGGLAPEGRRTPLLGGAIPQGVRVNSLPPSLPHLLWGLAGREGWEVELELLCLHFCHLLKSVSSLIAQVPGVSSPDPSTETLCSDLCDRRGPPFWPLLRSPGHLWARQLPPEPVDSGSLVLLRCPAFLECAGRGRPGFLDSLCSSPSPSSRSMVDSLFGPCSPAGALPSPSRREHVAFGLVNPCISGFSFDV